MAAMRKRDAGAIQALNMPTLLDVEEDGQQRPGSIAMRPGRIEVGSIQDTWEIVDEWWRANPIARRYFRVVLEDGRGMTVFRDLIGGLWYEQRA